MRWDGQALGADDGALPGLGRAGLARLGLVRSVTTPEFAGVTFHEVHAKSALTQVPAASRMPFRWTVNPYRGCSHACSYCVSTSTPVLMADGRQKPIGEIVVGEEIIGTRLEGRDRRYVTTTVEATWRSRKPAHRLTLRDGTVIVASDDHRFLARGHGWKHLRPAPAGAARRPYLTGSDSLTGLGSSGLRQGPFPPARPADPRQLAIVGTPVESSTGLGVASVEDLHRTEEMVDITTGTGDFVANGVIAHNCFARPTHQYLDLDAGADFDSQVVVKTNVDQVLRAELARPGWRREPVALGTNTDPYQRAEGRYRLMPGIIAALAGSGTPFSILTKGTLLRRDLPLLVEAAGRVEVGLGVSLAFADEDLQQAVEPGTPTPRARLALVRAVRDAGLPCGVMVAPVLPWLTDSRDHLRRLLDEIADAGATGVTVLPLHLKPGTREWYLQWLRRDHPHLADGYGRVFARGTYPLAGYRDWLWERVQPLLDERGFGRSGHRAGSGATGRPADGLRAHDEGDYPSGSIVAAVPGPGGPTAHADGGAGGGGTTGTLF
ncbi:Rv2578c family radical SAM protein [Isoptericola jiangsuensis]|uniref:Rv2578c family radical SAM protein n=1 Tax=Isoptericola jiangsuensis TaxID=548579 RepID=UPI003AAFCAC7